jgi:hypothetical protein
VVPTSVKETDMPEQPEPPTSAEEATARVDKVLKRLGVAGRVKAVNVYRTEETVDVVMTRVPSRVRPLDIDHAIRAALGSQFKVLLTMPEGWGSTPPPLGPPPGARF